MTASNGPAQVEERTALCDRLRRAGSDRRQGRRRDRGLELHGILHRKGRVHEDERGSIFQSHRWQDILPSDLSSRYLADALGLLECSGAGFRTEPDGPAVPCSGHAMVSRCRALEPLTRRSNPREAAAAQGLVRRHGSRRRSRGRRTWRRPEIAPGGGQLARVQVAALQMKLMTQPSSLIVLASCRVRLPE